MNLTAKKRKEKAMTFQELQKHLENQVWNSNFQDIKTKGALKAYLRERCEFGLNKSFQTQEELENLINTTRQAPVKFRIPKGRKNEGQERTLFPEQREFYDFVKTAVIQGATRLEKIVGNCRLTLRDNGIGGYINECVVITEPERRVVIKADSLEQMVGYFFCDITGGDLEDWKPITRY